MSINVAANPTAAIFAVGTLIGEAPRRIEWPTPTVQACLVELQPLFVCYDLHLFNYECNIEIMTVLLISKIEDNANKGELPYDQLVLAMGSVTNTSRIPGSEFA